MLRIWDLRAEFYDLCEGSALRRGPQKASLFRNMMGRTLFVATGTGLDIRHFPPLREIVAIDISERMLRKAEARRRNYRGVLRFVQANALNLCFPDGSFDTVATSCTMCSVPEPIPVFREFHRVLRPAGQLLMFEHVRSRNLILGLALDPMTLWTRLVGTEMNRDTLGNATRAGFRFTRIESAYLDIILSMRAVKGRLTD